MLVLGRGLTVIYLAFSCVLGLELGTGKAEMGRVLVTCPLMCSQVISVKKQQTLQGQEVMGLEKSEQASWRRRELSCFLKGGNHSLGHGRDSQFQVVLSLVSTGVKLRS